ncbi:hypothetical protein Loa_01574 [Legionella oakridgensis ATCC 33761 = DSM 21215]|uniref:Uncharacterized protein n=2 Tax=Legionella oakridgensis TaxID=29423 RepID=W0BER2_9GAMM|nr:hypothetical protein Loa_01574 [Legionella oakridgensis ATCC 33761 = DSM 21215]
MSKNITWYGLNLLPIYVEMVESWLEESCAQLKKLQQMKPHSDYVDKETLFRLVKSHRSQNTDNWALFAQCKHWRNQNPNEEQLRFIAQVEKNAAKLDAVNQEIASLFKSFQQKEKDIKENMDITFEWLFKNLVDKAIYFNHESI